MYLEPQCRTDSYTVRFTYEALRGSSVEIWGGRGRRKMVAPMEMEASLISTLSLSCLNFKQGLKWSPDYKKADTMTPILCFPKSKMKILDQSSNSQMGSKELQSSVERTQGLMAM